MIKIKIEYKEYLLRSFVIDYESRIITVSFDSRFDDNDSYLVYKPSVAVEFTTFVAKVRPFNVNVVMDYTGRVETKFEAYF